MILDTLATTFEARGISAVLSAHTRLASVQDRVSLTQAKLAQTSPASKGYFAIRQQAIEAQRALAGAFLAESVRSTAAAAAMIVVLDRLTDRYVRFSAEVMNIRSLTGASGRDSVQAALLGQVAGIQDTTEIRELLRSGSAVFSGKGQEALGRLGISANPLQSGLSLIGQISDKLNGMQDGLRKTQIMEDIFGQRGVAAMLPLLRLTAQQRAEVAALSNAYSTDGLAAVQQYQFQSALLGASFEQNVVFPIANSVMPSLTALFRILTWVTQEMGALNDMTQGFLGWVIAMAAVGVAGATLYRGIMMLVAAYRALAATEIVARIMAGDVSAIVTAGVATATAAAVIAGIDHSLGSGASGQMSAADKMDKAGDKLVSAATRIGDVFDDMKGGSGIPRGLSQADIGMIYKAGALGNIG